MPSCAMTDNKSNINELQADESVIAGEEKKKNPTSKLIEVKKAPSQGWVWLGWGYRDPTGDF